MTPDNAIQIAGAFLGVCIGVAVLVKAMTSGYGGVISAVQNQNNQQQTQLNQQGSELVELKVKLVQKDRECDEKIAAVSARTTEMERKINGGTEGMTQAIARLDKSRQENRDDISELQRGAGP